MSRKYTDEHIDFIRSHSEGNNTKILTSMFNKHFKTSYPECIIASLRYRNRCLSGVDNKGLRNSPDTEFKKGHIPFNKGLKGVHYSPGTEFKPGSKPVNMHPIGTIMFKADGYKWIKLAETMPSRFGWKQLHVHRWNQVHGPVPKGHKLLFLDGNRDNCDIDNLMLVTDAQLCVMNKKRLIFKDPDITKTGVIMADLISKVYSRQKTFTKARGVMNDNSDH